MDRTPYGEILRDTGRRRRMVYEALTNSSDPMAREIGEQLHSGAVSPRDLLTQPAYREFFAQALIAGENLDIQKLETTAATLVDSDQLTGDLQRDLAATAPASAREDEAGTTERKPSHTDERR